MKDVRLVLFSVFVDFTLSIAREDFIVVDSVRDIVEDDFVLVSIFEVEGRDFHSSEGFFCNVLGFFDVADVEEDACISEIFLVGFRLGDGDFVDFDIRSEEGLDYSLNLLFKILIIEIFGFSLL